MSNNHDGLMVLGAFLKVGKHNAEFDKIVNVIPDIKTNGSSATLQEPIDHRKLLPGKFNCANILSLFINMHEKTKCKYIIKRI
jgi:carbonic anhydrase